MVLGRRPCLKGKLVHMAKAQLLQWEPGAMESISALKLSMLACGHSNMPLIALISGKFRVSSHGFRAPTMPQRQTGAHG